MPPFVQTDEPLVMYRDTSVTEYPVNQDSLTVKYTAEARRFIEKNSSNKPFFFYLAYNMPHLPIHTTAEFKDTSKAGLYGDVVQTIDWSVGEITKLLKKRGIAENTIIFFASDNGPWLNPPDRMMQAGNKPWHQGTTGPLRGAKATTFEGGTRVPAMIRWPTHIPAGQVTDALIANPDVYRTLLAIGGGSIPDSLDGYNMIPFFTGAVDTSPRKEYAYFLYGRLEALRIGLWKLKLTDKSTELYNLQDDVAERYNRAQNHPEIVERLRKRMDELAKEYNVQLPTSK